MWEVNECKLYEISTNQTAVSVHLSEIAKSNINYNTESCIFTWYVYFFIPCTIWY